MQRVKVNLALALLLLLAACSSDSASGPTSAERSGSIIGHVTAKEMDLSVSADKEGALVELVGTNHQCLTDSNGLWRLDGVEPGYYLLKVSRDHFTDAYRANQLPFLGTGEMNYDDLDQLIQYRVPSFRVELDTVSFHSAALDNDTFYYLDYQCTTRDTSGKISWPRYISLFVGVDSTVTVADARSYVYSGAGNSGRLYVDAMMKRFDEVYVVAYATNYMPVLSGSPSVGKKQLQLGPRSNVYKLKIR